MMSENGSQKGKGMIMPAALLPMPLCSRNSSIKPFVRGASLCAKTVSCVVIQVILATGKAARSLRRTGSL